MTEGFPSYNMGEQEVMALGEVQGWHSKTLQLSIPQTPCAHPSHARMGLATPCDDAQDDFKVGETEA